ncbi:hypothetical protein TREMEDRAFT_36890 [Tremella mesenterica DSM 1558]|uniref:uncharacterized protein n=1 Tax=Tremella mesenterica (strain ATCC 24925 / CBS 8224 / DSM 1558 / NBRC 9311 / NRRL Y-6157 / RJB 2259-6 / UBC 559-6) TaxID=578456 RepID=UPI0003F49AB2|nr:uncharacterized protein TREMEDRAFT_36890 [Tremella mesenterica DSM 1558]EIW72716.1 hypothetical protein TREMEDRAFT_36890 [Tremella mesenterica DSM 1558]
MRMTSTPRGFARAILLSRGISTPKRCFTTATEKPVIPQVVFSGIQPTGTPHLGNYLGLFLPFLKLQRSLPPGIPLYLSVVGLHAITLPQDPKTLAEDRMNMMASLMACGVDPQRTCLFFQEEVPEHAELAWILNTLTSVGKLQRMTTWKSKIATKINASEDNVTQSDLRLGLLAYPVLQAADVLLYKATQVPVGEDQTQHLELTKGIAETFNRKYGPTFPIPKTMIVPSKRILNLRDPSQKMSKSSPNPLSRITILDPPQTILSNLKAAVTDSLPGVTYDPISRPGVSNLLTIWSALDPSNRTPEQLVEECGEWGLGKLKEHVGEVIVESLKGIKEEYERIRSADGFLRSVAKDGREWAGGVAKVTMKEVKQKVGLGPLE